jgi:hypothetical protein
MWTVAANAAIVANRECLFMDRRLREGKCVAKDNGAGRTASTAKPYYNAGEGAGKVREGLHITCHWHLNRVRSGVLCAGSQFG